MMHSQEVNAFTQSISAYTSWLDRFRRVVEAWRDKLISEAELINFQMFLLEMGQYNANFTLDELKQLHYPRSPFMTMHDHTYIRAVDTSAMQILRAKYQEEKGTQLLPTWIDSVLFWHELGRYCFVLRENDIDNTTLSPRLFNKPIWVSLNHPHDNKYKNHQDNIIRKIRGKLRSTIIAECAENLGLEESLTDYLIALASQNAIKGSYKSEAPLFQNLKLLFQEINDINLTSIFSELLNKKISNAKLNKILSDIISNIFMMTKIDLDESIKSKESLQIVELELASCVHTDSLDSWSNHLFPLIKKYKIDINVDKKELRSLLENRAQHILLLEKVFNAISYVYIGKKWLDEYVMPQLEQLLDKVIYFFQDNFRGIEAIVFCDVSKETGLPGFVISVLGNLGYRLDPITAIRKLLELYPRLFVDHDQSEEVFKFLLTLPMVANLPEEEKNAVKITCNRALAYIRSDAEETLITEIENEDEGGEDSESSASEEEFDVLDLPSQLEVLKDQLQYSNVSSDKLYLSLVGDYIVSYLKLQPKCHLRMICDPEMIQALKKINNSPINGLAEIVKYVQVIVDIMVLHLYFVARSDFPNFVAKQYLSGFSIQKILLTPYAMRAYLRVFQAMDVIYQDTVLNVIVTNQGYFEWLQNLERIDSRRAIVTRIQHLEDINFDVDIIFIEFHPNNVVESKQFQHDPIKLLEMIEERKRQSNQKPITLVIDATLNSLNGYEMTSFLQKSSKLVDEGFLNIILVQSLTKFSQFGLDRRSAGMVVVINNNNQIWSILNNKFEELKSVEAIDPSTSMYFLYFCAYHKHHDIYLKLVNSNVNLLYNKIIEKINEFGFLSGNRLQITINSDAGACYVALNLNHLFADADPNFKISTREVERFTKDLLRYLIIPLCQGFRLPLTQRMSIGFPLTSIGAVYTSLRITVGLEVEETIDHYGTIFALISFVLNKQRDLHLLFDATDSYSRRKKYFTHVALQFISMSPDLNKKYVCYFNPSTNEELTEYEKMRPGEKYVKILFSDKSLYIDRIILHQQGGMSFRSYQIIVNFGGDVKRNFSELDWVTRRFCIISIFPYIGCHHQILNQMLKFDDENGVTYLDCSQEPNQKDIYALFGPFSTQYGSLYFYRKEQQIFCHLKGKPYLLNREGILQAIMPEIAFVKYKHIITPLSRLPIEEWDYFFREGAYTTKLSSAGENAPSEFKRVDSHYIPVNRAPRNISISLEDNDLVFLMIEMDFRSVYNKSGVSVYKRYIDEKYTCYEIDYWSEKNPINARFFRLLTAIMVKNVNSNIQFSAYNNHYFRFLFNLRYDEADDLFSKAIRSIVKCRVALIDLLGNSFNNDIYRFINESTMRLWPSGNVGITSVHNNKLILAALGIVTPVTELSPRDQTVQNTFSLTEFAEQQWEGAPDPHSPHQKSNPRPTVPMSNLGFFSKDGAIETSSRRHPPECEPISPYQDAKQEPSLSPMLPDKKKRE